MINNNLNNFQNYYKILELDNNASLDNIKKAYRKLSLKYHPDRNNNSDNNFKEINIAYDYLTKNYNTILTNYNENNILSSQYNSNLNNSNLNNNLNNSNLNNNLNNSNYKELDNNFIEDLEIDLNITFNQALNGANIPVNISREIINNNYKKYENETLYIEIPRGIDNNEIIIIKNKGNIKNYKSGDLKIIIILNNHDIFTRDGLNIIYYKQITFKESLTGVNFILNHINNKNYKIENTNGEILTNNSTIILPKLGFSRNDYSGDLIIKFIINYPKQLPIEIISQLKIIL